MEPRQLPYSIGQKSEKVLHERRSAYVTIVRAASRHGVHEWPWLISACATRLLHHTIACAHPDTLSLLLSASYIAVRKMSVVCVSVELTYAMSVGQMAHITPTLLL